MIAERVKAMDLKTGDQIICPGVILAHCRDVGRKPEEIDVFSLIGVATQNVTSASYFADLAHIVWRQGGNTGSHVVHIDTAFFKVRVEKPEITDMSRWPSRCLSCGSPGYYGGGLADCSNTKCQNHRG